MNFVFFGTSEFAIPILDALKGAGWLPELVATTPDRPAGRKLKPISPPVKIWAEKNNIRCLQPDDLKNTELIEKLKSLKVQLFIVASYGKIIPKEILEIPEKGALNVHPSLLPRYRGADPVRTAILTGDEKTGVTIMLMDEKMDHGPIIANNQLPITNNQNYEILENELAELGGKLLVEVIPKWLAGKITPKEQNHELATFTKKIIKEDGHLNWNESAEIIERRIRALNPWPGTYAFWNEKRIKILEGQELANAVSKSPGEVFKHDSGLAVWCAKNAILIKKIQLEGEKPQTANDFLNGHQRIIGAILD